MRKKKQCFVVGDEVRSMNGCFYGTVVQVDDYGADIKITSAHYPNDVGKTHRISWYDMPDSYKLVEKLPAGYDPGSPGWYHD